MTKDNRQGLSLEEINAGKNFCRYCYKGLAKLLHFCDETCCSNFLWEWSKQLRDNKK